MHELGVLCQAVRRVDEIAVQNGISIIKHITLEVGTESTFVPAFFEKLFPVAVENLPRFKDSVLKIVMAPGRNLIIKDIGY